MKLEIELVPATCFYSSLREAMGRSKWDEVRKKIYAEYSHSCAICGAKPKVLHAHEKWLYNDAKKIQKLDKLVALCVDCHMCKHPGFSKGTKEGLGAFDPDKLDAHFCKVNNCSKAEHEKYENAAFAEWNERSKHPWRIDLSNAMAYEPNIREIEKIINSKR